MTVSVTIRLIVTGPNDSGKSQLIQTLSESKSVTANVCGFNDNGQPNSNPLSIMMDYGCFEWDNGEQVTLYGTLGQRQFDYLWSRQIKDADGIILLLSNTRPDPLADLSYYLDTFELLAEDKPLVIGITHTDEKATPWLEDYQQLLAIRGYNLPVFSTDARQSKAVRLLIYALFASMEDGISALDVTT